MTKRMNGMNNPTNKGALKRVSGVLVVLLVVATLMVGAVSATGPWQVGENTYVNLSDALTEDNKGKVINLTASVEGYGTVFAEGSNYVIDLCGNTYTINSTVGSSGTETIGLQLLGTSYNPSTITIANGTINAKVGVVTNHSGVDKNLKMLIQNYANLTLFNVKLDGSNLVGVNYTLSNNHGDVVLMGDTNITAATDGVAFDVWYSLSEGYDDGVGVSIIGPDVKINGKVEYGHNDQVTDEEFIRNTYLVISEDYDPEFTVFDSGSADLTGYEWVNIGESPELGMDLYMYILPPVAQIGDDQYLSLADAFAAVPDNIETTITLLCDAQGDGIVVPSGKNIILDLNEFTYTVSGSTVGSANTETNCFQFLRGSTIVINDGTLKATSPSAYIFLQNYADLTLNNVKVYGAVDTGYVSSNNCGDVVYKGNTELIATEGNVAFDVWYNHESNYSEGVSVTIADTNVKIIGGVEYGCNARSNGNTDFPEAAVLLIPEGYTLAVPTVSSNAGITPTNFCWGVDEAHPGMLKLVPCDPVEPEVEATITPPQQDGNTTLSGPDVATALSGKGGEIVSELVLETTGAKVVITYNSTGGTVDASAQTVEGNITSIVAAYDEVAAPSDEVNIPVTFALEVTLNTSALGTNFVLPIINQTFIDEVKEIAKGENKNFHAFAQINGTAPTGITMEQLNGNITEIKLTFTVPADFVTKYGQGKFFVLHVKDGIVIETLTPVWAADGKSFTVTGTKGFSDYVVVVDTYVAPKDTSSGSSSSSGSSVWLQEPVTPTEQPTQTPTEEKPTDTVPTDIPSTQPTATPASPGFGILAALAGLGAVAALRRQ